MFNNPILKTTILTGLALFAFAANSVLCRLALGNETIDAGLFTVLRLLSGSIVLFVILKFKKNTGEYISKGSWSSSFLLFVYAVTFSYAYISLDTGTGALILFGFVQITIIVLSVISGTRLHFTEWVGTILSFSGFVYLILPGVSAPSINGFLLMAVAGIVSGVYTLKGHTSKNPLMDTAYNFFRTTPLVILLLIFTFNNANYSQQGILLALLSGGIASAIGYVIWYVALGGLSSIQAAVVQLLVPVIAVLGGVLLVYEKISLRLAISSMMVIGGVLLVVLGKYYFSQKKATSP